ncbi:hypothetical protein [Granulicella tundricola]|uniref:Thioredoxin domain-containing protein n=1 Tax=Granulicella tundricola (strain ATCC BAA-1859 / DSM 23138 / MP5ACTX9) TaxID=1198114 RepID=E8X5Y4_GRATM|nr:hypothetical protein [Granulicella tundricola]ADW70868.1 hypothetical protein AciX9_4086 [Granulicella tundricola MP5ACTX9]
MIHLCLACPLLTLQILCSPALHAQKQAVTPHAILQQKTPLPAFTLWTAEGATVDNTHVNPGGYWLLLYRDLDSTAADQALQLLESLTTPSTLVGPNGALPPLPLDPARLIILVTHATGAQLSQLQLAHSALATAIWMRDQNSSAAAALNIAGFPQLLGLHENARRWQLAGSLEQPTTRAAILSWINNNALPKTSSPSSSSSP